MTYKVQEKLKPRSLSGISDGQIEQHWQLYEGYVKNTNELLDELRGAETGSRHWAELKRRLGFEFNGMALHEYYFGNLAADRALSPKSALADALATGWGDFRAWREGFAKTGAPRGIGWGRRSGGGGWGGGSRIGGPARHGGPRRCREATRLEFTS